MSVMILRSVVLSEEGGPAICCVLTMYLSYFAEMGATSTASGRLIDESLSIRKFGREEPLWYKFLFWLPQESGDFA
jgi:hypothetical protein